MRKGTIQPNGQVVRRLRTERGWTQDDLARQVGCVKRTIENAESSKPVYVGTLGEIAEALGVRPQELTAGGNMETDGGKTSDRITVSEERIGNAPPLPPLLIGREADLLNLAGRLARAPVETGHATTQVLTAVRGWPGVGKTSLARAIAHLPELAEAFPDGVLWASLGPSPSILAELIAWGRALGDREVLLAKDVTEVTHRLAGLLRGRRTLLIVDDVWEASHVIPFAAGGRHCAMLVTTRSSRVADDLAPTPGDIYRLEVLSEDESLRLLESLAPEVVESSREECRQLVQEIEGLPLALQVAGRMLRIEHERGWSVADLLSELREDKAKLLEAQAPVDMAVPGEVSPTVTALLRKSTDCLEPIIRKRFAYIAPFAPRPAMFEIEDLMAVWKVDKSEARQTVDVLVDRGLLEPIGDGEYQVHQVLVQHAKTLL